MRDTFIIGSRALDLSPEVRKQIAAKVRQHRILERTHPRRDSARDVLERELRMTQPVKESAPQFNDDGRESERRYERTCEREARSQRALDQLDAIKLRGPSW